MFTRILIRSHINAASVGAALLCGIVLAIFSATSLRAAEPEASAESYAEDSAEPGARIYRSPAERREAGLGRRVTDWLTVSGLAEAETETWDNNYRGGPSRDTTEHGQSLQLGLRFGYDESASAEFVFDYDISADRFELDEGLINLDWNNWSFEAGRLYVPFGEYYSHFVTGPVLEFGETRGYAAVADYALTEGLDLIGFVVDGDVGESRSRASRMDWGGGFEYASQDDSIKLSATVISDLADTDDLLLEDIGTRFSRQVPGFNMYALIGRDRYEITAEYVQALRSFRELDNELDRPWAANLELAWFPRDAFQFSVRAELSEEVPDQPQSRYGVSFSWLIGQHVSVSTDLLYGLYKDRFVLDDDDNILKSEYRAAAQISIEF